MRWQYGVDAGFFEISKEPLGDEFVLRFNGGWIGDFPTPEAAAESVALPSHRVTGCRDAQRRGVPESLVLWRRVGVASSPHRL